MRNIVRSISLSVIAALSLASCGAGGGGGGSPQQIPQTPDWQGTLIPVSSQSVSAVTAFLQSVPSDTTNVYYEIFPGQANAWTLSETDFSLLDGFGNQFFYALDLTVGTANLNNEVVTLNLPAQSYNELSFYTPYLGTDDGVKIAAVSDGVSFGLASLQSGWIAPVKLGSYAAFLNATSDSRLQQTIDLTSLPTNTTVTLSWQDAVSLDTGAFTDYTPNYRVVVYEQNGTPHVVYQTPIGTPLGQTLIHTNIQLDAYAHQRITLSFEERSSTSPATQAYAIIDNVSIKDIRNKEYITHGDFETGTLAGSGWTTNTPQEVQNVTSGSRTLDGLDVTRSFYAAPNKLWGRWVDVFTNPSLATAVTTTITYLTSLGSGGAGIIYTSTSGTKAITSWDAVTGSRDIGWVFGNKLVSSATYTSDNGTGTVGSDLVEVAFNITVPPGGRVALVNFIIMDGTDTGGKAPIGDITKKAATIDNEAAAILTHFWDDPQHQYLRGMTQQQVDAIKNF
jgi:hypothetical protein